MRFCFIFLTMLLIYNQKASSSQDTYTIKVEHKGGLSAVNNSIGLGTTNSLTVKKGDKVKVEIVNPFTPVWEYDKKISSQDYKPDEKALAAIQQLVKVLGLNGKVNGSGLYVTQSSSNEIDSDQILLDSIRKYSQNIKMLESYYVDKHKIEAEKMKSNQESPKQKELEKKQKELDTTIQDMKKEIRVLLNSIVPMMLEVITQPFGERDALEKSKNAKYEVLRNKGETGLTSQYKDEVKTWKGNCDDKLESLIKVIKALEATSIPSEDQDKSTIMIVQSLNIIHKLISESFDKWYKSQMAFLEKAEFEFLIEKEENTIVITAINRLDTNQKLEPLELKVNIEYSRPIVTFTPVVGFLYGNSPSGYSLKKDSTGTLTPTDTSQSSYVIPRIGSVLNLWIHSFDKINGIDMGVGGYFGYAHNYTFDIGAQITFAYKDYLTISFGYIDASFPEKATTINGVSTQDDVILNFTRLKTFVLGIGIGKLP